MLGYPHGQSGPRVFDWSTANTYNLEIHAETLRCQAFPEKPSRLSVFFCARRLSDILSWNEYFPLSPGSRICEIEYDGPLYEFDARFLRGIALPVEPVNLDSSDMDQLAQNISQVRRNLFLYWSGARSENPLPEVLVPLPVVIRRIASLGSYPDFGRFDPPSGNPR